MLPITWIWDKINEKWEYIFCHLKMNNYFMFLLNIMQPTLSNLYTRVVWITWGSIDRRPQPSFVEPNTIMHHCHKSALSLCGDAKSYFSLAQWIMLLDLFNDNKIFKLNTLSFYSLKCFVQMVFRQFPNISV